MLYIKKIMLYMRTERMDRLYERTAAGRESCKILREQVKSYKSAE